MFFSETSNTCKNFQNPKNGEKWLSMGGFRPINIMVLGFLQVRVCDTPLENSELLETCLSDNKEVCSSSEKIRNSDQSAVLPRTESSTARSTALRKTVSDQNFDYDEVEEGKMFLHPDSARDLMKNALNLPEVIGRREKLVWAGGSTFWCTKCCITWSWKSLEKYHPFCYLKKSWQLTWLLFISCLFIFFLFIYISKYNSSTSSTVPAEICCITSWVTLSKFQVWVSVLSL